MAKPEKRNNAKRANRPNPREDRNINKFSVPTFNTEQRIKKKVELLPRNLRQEEYIDLLEDDTKNIVFSMGPAGTGKTLLATLYAIKQFQAGEIEKIIITRPLVATGENIGALPGDLIAKLSPWCIPVLDIFKEIYSVNYVKKLLEEETLELAALSLMRGRSLKRCVVIGDEMQNATKEQMKMFLTRIGDDCKMIVTGDVAQHDRAYTDNNGLKDFIHRLEQKQPNRIGMVKFHQNEVERHPVIEDVLGLYGDE